MVDHRIIDTGPYHFIRHAAYAGMILTNIGIYVLNWVTTILFVLPLAPAIVFRIFIEERMLLEMDGYSDFARSRKRLVLLIW